MRLQQPWQWFPGLQPRRLGGEGDPVVERRWRTSLASPSGAGEQA